MGNSEGLKGGVTALGVHSCGTLNQESFHHTHQRNVRGVSIGQVAVQLGIKLGCRQLAVGIGVQRQELGVQGRQRGVVAGIKRVGCRRGREGGGLGWSGWERDRTRPLLAAGAPGIR